MSEITYKVEKTSDYGTFKRLDGNRPVQEGRMDDKYGWYTNKYGDKYEED